MTSRLWVRESPIEMIEGETVTYSMVWEGATAASSTTAVVYLNEEVYTSTAMPSGSHSSSGNVSTLKPIVATDGDGGEDYIVVIQAVVDGNTERRKLRIIVLKDEEE